jgi:hypothetical protein
LISALARSSNRGEQTARAEQSARSEQTGREDRIARADLSMGGDQKPRSDRGKVIAGGFSSTRGPAA